MRAYTCGEVSFLLFIIKCRLLKLVEVCIEFNDGRSTLNQGTRRKEFNVF